MLGVLWTMTVRSPAMNALIRDRDTVLGTHRLRGANPALGARGLYAAAMRIGRDHVSSAVNTLVLAYAGASLPLLLIFSVSGRGLGDVVTSEEVATEIVEPSWAASAWSPRYRSPP
jgi:hypothetical protein